MTTYEILATIQQNKVFAVIRDQHKDRALRSAYALLEGGINLIEISFLTTGANEIIAQLRKENLFVGAGTVMNESMCSQAIESGSYFIVSPHTDELIIKKALDHSLIVSAGCVTPTEIIYAQNLKVQMIKIFPAHSFGGVNYIKSLLAVFPNINFMPTGGVNDKNMTDYFNAGAIAVGISTALLPPMLIQDEQFHKITELAKAICKVRDEYVISIS